MSTMMVRLSRCHLHVVRFIGKVKTTTVERNIYICYVCTIFYASVNNLKPVSPSFVRCHHILARVTRRVLQDELELLIIPGHMSSSQVYMGFRLPKLFLWVKFCRSFFVFCFLLAILFCPSIYGFWLSLWYLLTFPNLVNQENVDLISRRKTQISLILIWTHDVTAH